MKKFDNERNLSMLMDFYELTMANGYFNDGLKDQVVCFDMFYRKNPDGAGFSIAAGLDQIIQYINELSFTENNIEYLRSKGIFSEDFLDYLLNFEFTGDIYAVPEGTPVFPGEPLLTVRAKALEAQILETMILVTLNHQCLIATKANRICTSAKGRPVMEFGARRCQGYDGAIYGARAAYIGGVAGTATTLADEKFGVPAVGTMAHSWVQLYGDEYTAFKKYAECYPDNCLLLIDTYNILNSGLPNAMKVAKDVLEPLGQRLKGVRIDSGDMAYLTKKCRKILDENGFEDCKITVSNSLDEYLIRDLLNQGAAIDSFGVGERLVTAKSEPVFGGVYKLVAVQSEDEYLPRIKISENPEKVTNPGFKKIYRLFDKTSKKAIVDVITLVDEIIDDSKPYIIFDPVHTWKKKTLTNFTAVELQKPIFKDGEQVYTSPSLNEIRKYSSIQLSTLWSEVKRFSNPHQYYVDLSPKLWNMKHDLIEKYSMK